MNILERAIPLIEIQGGQLSVSPEAISILEGIDNVAVISICGLPLTGKSSIINWVLDKHDCFPVSNSHDKKNFDVKVHVWISSTTYASPDGAQYRILWLDLEGIIHHARTAAPASQNLVSIAVLLSSCLIYNSKGNPDDDAISNMSFLGDLSKSIRVSAVDEPEKDILNFPKIFPKLVWSVRDVQLDNLPITQRSLNPSQTMEAILVPTKGFDRPTFERNRIRNILTTFFIDRKCVFLMNPDTNVSVSKSALNMDFQLCLSLFEKEIMTDLKIKTVCGIKLNGSTFVKLLGVYLRSINANELPTVSSAWAEVCVLESHASVTRAMQLYCYLMDAKLAPEKLPRDEKEIVAADEAARAEALAKFHSTFLGESTIHMVDVLVDAMCKQYRVYEEENKKASQRLAEAVLLDLYGTHIRPNLITDKPNRIKYVHDIQALRNDWRTMTFQLHQSVKGPGKYVVLSEFSRETLLDAIGIITTALREEFESNANLAVGVTQKTFDELSDALQSSLNDLLACQSALTAANQKVELYRSSCDDLQARLKDVTSELELSKSSRSTWEVESSTAIKSLEGALHAQTELCVIKDGTINALKADLALATSKLQAEVQTSHNYLIDLESAQGALTAFEASHHRQMIEKDEEITKIMRQVDDKIWEAEKEARHKEMEMSATSAEIIAFQSGQLAEQVKKFDELKVKMKEDAEAYEGELLRREDEISDLKRQLQHEKDSRADDISKLERDIADIKDLHRKENTDWQDQYEAAMKTIDDNELSIKRKNEEISSLKAEITCLSFVESTLNEKIEVQQHEKQQSDLEIERLKKNLETSGCTSQEQYQMLDDLRQDLDSKTMTITQLLMSLEDARLEIEQQKGRLAVLEADALQRREEIKNLNTDIENLQNEKVGLTVKVLELEKSLQTSHDLETDLRSQIKTLEESIVDKEETIRVLSTCIEEHKETIEAQQKLANDAETAASATAAAFEDKIAAVIASEKEAQGVRDVLLQINQELTENNAVLSEENKHLKQTYGGMHDNFERAKQEIGGKLRNEEVTKQTLADALYERECQLEMTNRELSLTTAKRDELATKLEACEEEIHEKTTILSAMEDRIRQLEDECGSLVAKGHKQEEEIASLNAEKARFFDEMQYVISTAKEAENKLRRELDAVQGDLVLKNTLLTPTNTALQELTERLAEVRVDLEVMTTKHQALEKELAATLLDRDKLQDECFSQQEKISTLECAAVVTLSEKESVEVKLSLLEEKLYARNEEYDQLSSRLSAMETEKMSLEGEKVRLREDDTVLQRMLTASTNEKFILEAEVENFKDSIRRLNDRIGANDSLISEQRDALAERDYTISQLESSVEEISERARDYKNTIDEQAQKIHELIKSLTAMTMLSESLEQSKKDLNEQLQLLEENFRKTNGEQTARIIEQNNTVSKLELRISELQQMVDEDLVSQLKHDIEDKNQETTELTNVYIKLRQRVTDLEEELSGRNVETEKLRVENRENLAMLRELTPQLEKLKSASLEEKELTAELEKAKKLGESYKGELIVARERIMELERAFQDTIEKMMTSAQK